MNNEEVIELSEGDSIIYMENFLKIVKTYDLTEIKESGEDYWLLQARDAFTAVYIKKSPVPEVMEFIYVNRRINCPANRFKLLKSFRDTVHQLADYCRNLEFAKKPSEPEKEKTIVTENNGGKTSYYDLPKPTLKDLEPILLELIRGVQTVEAISIPLFVSRIQDVCPQTLNDLIEFKKMEFWQGEILKADYGLSGRIQKLAGYTPREAEIRELNKIVYYANRRLNRLLKEENDETNG